MVESPRIELGSHPLQGCAEMTTLAHSPCKVKINGSDSPRFHHGFYAPSRPFAACLKCAAESSFLPITLSLQRDVF